MITRLVGFGARRDARLGLESGEERIIAAIGTRPAFDVMGNAMHAELARDLAADAERADLKADLVRLEDIIALHSSPLALGISIAVATAFESLGAILIMKTMSLARGEQLVLGLSLAVFVIGVTAVAAQRTTNRQMRGQEDEKRSRSVGASMRRSLGTLVILGIYTVFVGAIVVIRVAGTTDELVSRAESLAHAVIMVATSIGPAWFVERQVRMYVPAQNARKQARLVRHRLRKAEGARERAQAAINKIASDAARWDAEAARRRAVYQTEHRLETQRRQNANAK